MMRGATLLVVEAAVVKHDSAAARNLAVATTRYGITDLIPLPPDRGLQLVHDGSEMARML